MIVVASLILSMQDPAAVDPTQAQDIIVVGQRLKAWRGKFSVRGGKTTCRTSTSTGDKEIDAIGCRSMTECLPPLQPRIIASDAKGIDAADRKAMKAAVVHDLQVCVKDRNDVLTAALVQRRAQGPQPIR